MKLLDKINRILRSKGYIIRNPVKRKPAFAKPGKCKFFDSTETEFIISFKEEAEEKAKETQLPHEV